jgi:hypothetical protein
MSFEENHQTYVDPTHKYTHDLILEAGFLSALLDKALTFTNRRFKRRGKRVLYLNWCGRQMSLDQSRIHSSVLRLIRDTNQKQRGTHRIKRICVGINLLSMTQIIRLRKYQVSEAV